MKGKRVQIDVSEDEAIVFFEWLQRFAENGGAEIQDQAEERVLWDITAQLEKYLTAPLSPSYLEKLAQARSKVRD